MLGNHSGIDPLAARKQLLIAESELNRPQLVSELAALTAGVRTLSDRAKSFGSIAATAAMLVTAVADFRSGKSGSADTKPSRWQSILKSAGLISTFWLAVRPPDRDHKAG